MKSILALKENAKSLKELLGGLKSEKRVDSQNAGIEFAEKAKEYGLALDDYLRFAVDLDADEEGKNIKQLDWMVTKPRWLIWACR